ncbi:coiled-coil domain-containing protein 97-like isoform X2 [Oculina patagonica]
MATSTCFAGDVNQVRTMLCRVASSEAVVKSQQRSEPKLTVDKKVDILQEMFEKKPTSFLMRFGRYLAREDLQNFEHVRGDYEIDFRLNEVKNIIDSKKTKTGIRNRRYECLQRLMKDSDYFSEENMRKRSPLLYEEYIGQYLTEEEKLDRDRAEMGADPCLSELIMNRQEKEMNDWLLDYQRDQEACVQEEEDDSDMESDTNQVESGSTIKGCPTEQEKHLLHEEFLSVMQDRFMRGEEEEFDYSAVDTNDEYDDLTIRERDEEENYFDSEEVSSAY